MLNYLKGSLSGADHLPCDVHSSHGSYGVWQTGHDVHHLARDPARAHRTLPGRHHGDGL